MSHELNHQSIVKKVLSNGLVILVRPLSNVPKVAIQLWYHVGSKDELTGEKGNAHLIEHMIFKGTEKLSETDITTITNKLSGYTNAFTSYDYTAYVFDFPSHHWKESFTLLSDCMRNCRFDEQMLNSELKAVIQELKLMKDNYFKIVWQSMISAIFFDHPYHYPVIGFKQDLWNLKRDDLFNFYRKHYVPNNAALVVVGDVDPEEVFKEAEKAFGHIPKDPSYKRQEFYSGKDLIAQSTVVYRDIQQPYGLFAFTFPGTKEKKRYETDVLAAVLAGGKSARLTKKLVDDLKLVTEFSVFPLYLEDATLFMFYFCARDENKIEEIRAVVLAEIKDIIENGIPHEELIKAIKQVKIRLLSSLESNGAQATMIGESYLLTGDEYLPFKMLANNDPQVEEKIRDLLKKYAIAATMHTTKLLPLTKEGKEYWADLQKLSDEEDARILNGRVRDIPVEAARYAHSVQVCDAKDFTFLKPKKYTLSNGIKVFEINNTTIPKIEIALTLDKGATDIDATPGLYGFVCQLLSEGTKNYPGNLFAQEKDKYGITILVHGGFVHISMLKEDLEKGVELLAELLMEATFEEVAIEKIRAAVLANIKMTWDNPQYYIVQLVRQNLYKGHPYGKDMIGTAENIASISKQELVDFYKTYFTAYKARLSVVGDIVGCDVRHILEKHLGRWKSLEVAKPAFPQLNDVTEKTVNHVVNRDQVVLAFACLSITRLDKDYDKLLLFDRILSGSMNSRLFRLREQTGLFYSINGSLTASADEQPGMFIVMTTVSLDRLEEAKQVIKKTLKEMVDSITQEELEFAKQAIIQGQIGKFASNLVIGISYLDLDQYNLADTYFDDRAAVINAITLDDVKEAARKILEKKELITVQVGRVE